MSKLAAGQGHFIVRLQDDRSGRDCHGRQPELIERRLLQQDFRCRLDVFIAGVIRYGICFTRMGTKIRDMNRRRRLFPVETKVRMRVRHSQDDEHPRENAKQHRFATEKRHAAKYANFIHQDRVNK
ncbi:MAG: hypothetical protein CMLOHMNK_01845 [Steroidobacteraceae bacterium]|nr:hypothetical protein [Steroidobacteraceae bacterium]